MSIEQPNVIDFLLCDKTTGHALLILSDHLDWEDDEDGHILLLQDKLNHYIHAIESGQIVKKMPELRDLPAVIYVWGKYPPSKQGAAFYEYAKQQALEAGFSLVFDLEGKSFDDRSLIPPVLG